MTDAVNHPPHYGGADNPYEAIKVIEAWGLGFCLGNAVKYISRAGKKTDPALQDLKKARWYIDREIQLLDPDAARGERADAAMAKQLRESIERNGALQAEIDRLRKQLGAGQ
jgi:phosphatidylserine/phosphatidylglycerophosphate/cardiolipin synthase-like enzyme